jgi:CBS domain-containing protein
MISALVMGMVKVNSSMRGRVLFERIDSAAYPFYVLFFVVAGANLHLKTLLYAGTLGIIYIIARLSAKIVGAAWGAHVAGFSSDLKGYLGPAMISHAGVAIGLAMAVGRLDSISGHVAQAIVLGSIVVYELIGPITVRFALVRCGEVKMVTLLPHLPGHSSVDNLQKVLHQVRRSLGLSARGFGMAGGHITAKHVMRSNVEAVRDNTRFDELLKVISHSHYDLVPVVDKNGRYIGNISFPRIRDVIFDRAVADLVIARDLLDYDAAYVTPEEPLGSILQKFQDLKNEVGNLPVVAEGEEPRVIGMIRQQDAVDTFWRLRSADRKRDRSR